MKKRYLLILISILVVGYSSSASALTLIPDTAIIASRAATAESTYVGVDGFINSGNFLGAFTGNDSNQQTELQSWLRTDGGFGDSFTLDEYFKDEYSDAQAAKSGEWSTDANIMFYVVKAARAFSLYEVAPSASSGTWSTYDLWVRGYGGNGGLEISHLSGYNGSASVPEPATALFLGIGLVGLAGFGRKRIIK